MATAALDPKLLDYQELLCDRSRRVSELDLRRVLNDLDDMLRRAAGHEITAFLRNLRAICFARLGRPTKSLAEFRLALQGLREPTQLHAWILGNQAAALLELRRYREAATSSIEASRIPGGYTRANLANLAEALYHLGEFEAALQTFQEALGLADLTNPAHCFSMAIEAAELGLDQDALELFAQFIVRKRGAEHDERPAIEIVRGASDEEKAGLENVPVLDATIRRLRAMANELARLSSHMGPQVEASSEEAQDVYEATRRLREEALSHVLST